MFIPSLIALGAVIIAGLAVLFSAHIPLLRHLTGAAPLLPDEPWPSGDLAGDSADRINQAAGGPEVAR